MNMIEALKKRKRIVIVCAICAVIFLSVLGTVLAVLMNRNTGTVQPPDEKGVLSGQKNADLNSENGQHTPNDTQDSTENTGGSYSEAANPDDRLEPNNINAEGDSPSQQNPKNNTGENVGGTEINSGENQEAAGGLTVKENSSSTQTEKNYDFPEEWNSPAPEETADNPSNTETSNSTDNQEVDTNPTEHENNSSDLEWGPLF